MSPDPASGLAPPSDWRVPEDGRFSIERWPSEPPRDAARGKEARSRLRKLVKRLDVLQRMLWAHDHHALLLVFQAMDAAGKDSAIRAVLSGVNPQGCQVYSFKKPSDEELDHDFLWRCAVRLPERWIGVWNRSHYEEVLVVRVHPGILEGQKLPDPIDSQRVWEERFEAIRGFEQHLARSGTVVLKFFLHVSKAEQRRRFLKRLEDPRKHWKFSPHDVRERGFWPAYMHAYQEALRATSRPWAPWYAIPADHKPYARLAVAEIAVQALEGLGLRYPEVEAGDRERFDEMRDILAGEP